MYIENVDRCENLSFVGVKISRTQEYCKKVKKQFSRQMPFRACRLFGMLSMLYLLQFCKTRVRICRPLTK